jgi:glycosyltransferase involved in cell wall biosynthesis
MGYHFVYLSEVDISIDNGRGINEREFVRSLLEAFPDAITCILPRPEYSERFSDARIEYVQKHSGSAFRYGLHLHDAYRRLRRIHAARQVSGLVTRLGVAPFVPLLARERLGIPTILKTLLVAEVFGARPLAKMHRVVTRSLSRVFRAVIEGCALADTVGVSVAEWTWRHYRIPKNRLVVIPNGANTDFFIPGDRLEARRALGLEHFGTLVGYIGILAAERNLEVLVEAMARLKGSDVGLLLVGSGPLRRALEELASHLGVGDRVIFLGQIDYRDVPKVTRALDVAIDLSLQRLRVTNGEAIPVSFSQKLAQYLATGVPVLAWDLPDTRVVIENDVGRLVPLEEPKAVGRALAELVSLPTEAREAMRRRSRHVAERDFSYRELVRKRMALWKAAVPQSSASG